MKYDAMIVIDIQTALIEAHPYHEDIVLGNIKKVIAACRTNHVPVIYVRHDGGVGDELEKGCPGWEIYKDIAPQRGEKVIDKKFNSIFRQTGLHEYLQSAGVKNLILCGMQTEYCFDVSCKVAFEKEYQVTVPKDSTTTFDTELASAKDLTEYFEEKIWNHRYASVLPIEEIISCLSNQ